MVSRLDFDPRSGIWPLIPALHADLIGPSLAPGDLDRDAAPKPIFGATLGRTFEAGLLAGDTVGQGAVNGKEIGCLGGYVTPENGGSQAVT